MTLTQDQVRERARGLGASDAAAAIGSHPFKSTPDLWLEKTGRLKRLDGADTPASHWGHLLEAAVRQEYARVTGRTVRQPRETLHHGSLPFVLCHPDGITDDARLYEGKTARFDFGWGDPGTDQIPEHYLIQVQHAMLVCTLEVADVAVLIGGQDFRVYEIPADREFQEEIIDAEVIFWQHVERDIMPEVKPDAPGALAILRRLFPGTDGTSIEADASAERWRTVYQEACEHRDVYSSAADAAKAHLLYSMRSAAKLKFADGRVLRRQLTKRKAYTVEATEYVDARFVNDKDKAA